MKGYVAEVTFLTPPSFGAPARLSERLNFVCEGRDGEKRLMADDKVEPSYRLGGLFAKSGAGIKAGGGPFLTADFGTMDRALPSF